MGETRTSRHLPTMGTFYTTKQLADFLQLKPRTIQRWIDAGQLPAYRFGRKYRIKGEDIDHFLDTYKLHDPSHVGETLPTETPPEPELTAEASPPLSAAPSAPPPPMNSAPRRKRRK